MTIRKIKGLESDFTIVPNSTINDNLSWEARGMLLYLCSKPNDWEVNISDLVNQTEGSRKQSKRDSVRVIMKELTEKGYMIKTQKRLSGKFQNVDHEVSFVPFTDFPSTAQPLTVNPTQQSKESTKEGFNKGLITDNFSGKQKESYRIERLSKNDFYHCHEAIRLLERWEGTYTGKLSLPEWSACEDSMRSVDCFDFEYIDWWMKNRSKSLRKNPSLPNMLCDFDNVGTTFEVFYDSFFMQECE